MSEVPAHNFPSYSIIKDPALFKVDISKGSQIGTN
jgi:hypothetical protein